MFLILQKPKQRISKMKLTFSKSNIEKAIKEFSGNQNFVYTALPRIKAIYAIKKEFKLLSNLEWFFEFDHVNVNNNRVLIHFKNNMSGDFAFYYEIPLIQNFELRVYLAKSSVHFLDIYNFMLDKKMIQENQFPLKAEYHTIPHFIINKETKRFNMGIISKYSDLSELDANVIDEKIKAEIEKGFDFFNPIFRQILNQFKI